VKRTPLRRRSLKQKRKIDHDYMAWIHTQPCLVCGCIPVEAHHVYAMCYGIRPPDRRAIPLCWTHDSRDSKASIHVLGKRFGPEYGIDVEAEIVRLNEKYEAEKSNQDQGSGRRYCAV